MQDSDLAKLIERRLSFSY